MAELTSEEQSPNSLPDSPCPECKSTKLYRDGLRYLADGSTIQRWLCRKCGLRFSDPTTSFKAKNALATIATVQTKPLKSKQTITNAYQICVRETKNLEPQTETKTVAGEKSQLKDDIEGLHAQYLAYLEREGFAEITRFPYLIRRLVRLGANLRDPESVKQTIGHLMKLNGEKASNGSKLQYVYAYDNFAKMLKIQWERPHYTQEEIIPFIPLEKELDTLIAFGRSKRLSTYLQTLKETYADPSEALRIKRKDVTGNIVTINYPVKGHYPGSIQVSNRLISMLNSLPVTSDRFFPTSYGVMSYSYINMRRRCAAFFQNPRIIEIELRSFRHWGGSMLAHYTNGNVLKVQKILRHKRIDSTMKYIQMLNIEEDEFEVTSATTIEEIKKLGSAGWAKYDELNINGMQVHFYKKPKRFGGL
jgi:integrase/ribosomal protein L37AE/L43A